MPAETFVPARALGVPLCRAMLKQQSDDFCVSEQLGFAPSGSGEHLWLRIRKRGLTTDAVTGDLARQLGVPRKLVSYSGLKDKWAVTEQWFSVPWPIRQDLPQLAGDSWQVIEASRHDRKLRRGVHQENRFDIVLRQLQGDAGELERRLQWIADNGVPNYFGEQRFGHDGGNVAAAEAMFAGQRCKPWQRSLYLSAARSYLFNHYLSRRVADGSWNQAIAGDVFNLDGSNAVFVADPINDDIHRRLQQLDIHPVGTLAGKGDSGLTGDAQAIQQQVFSEFPSLCQGLLQAGVESASRALRVRVKFVNWAINNNECRLQFSLRSGAFATAVVRELVLADGAC